MNAHIGSFPTFIIIGVILFVSGCKKYNKM